MLRDKKLVKIAVIKGQKSKRVHQRNKTELLVCVALGWSKTISQFLNLIDSLAFLK